MPEGIAIGDPERVLRACKRWEAVGVDRINFLLNALETVPQEDVLNSLRIFAKHVMPHFQEVRRRPRRREVVADAASGTMEVEAFAPNVGGNPRLQDRGMETQGRADSEHPLRGQTTNRQGLMPVTFHPVIPAYAIFNVTHYPESPAGPFTIADVRVGCRAGVRPRGFTLKSYVSTAAAAQELTRRWGYPASVADVSMRAFHDRVVGQRQS